MLDSLNSPQLEAVTTLDGPLLVLAGAGTGKTKVLTTRIVNIVNSYKASPLQILAVTFTNKAAAEMRKRISDIIGDQANNLWVGTFHSIAARIVRRHPEVVGLMSDFTIIDDDDQTRLLKQILSDLNIDPKQFAPKAYLNKISRFKDKMLLPSNMENQGFDVSLPQLKEVYQIYQSRLKSMNSADFGDLLLHNLTIFNQAPEILSYYQDKFRYILVDEYQDTNNAQYSWLLKLANVHKNICCVGDDDQSIYSWRGANIANILRFEKDFAGAKVIRLEQNYRSTSLILKAADSVIKNNKERHGKTLWTDAGKGEKIKLRSFIDDRSEASTIAQVIKGHLMSKKFSANEIAVLVRAGYQTRSFEEAFIQNSIPYKVIGGMKFYERAEIRDALAYLRICANLNDDLALNRIINVPKRGAGDAAISAIYQKSKSQNIPFFFALKEALEEGIIKGKAKESLGFLCQKLEEYNAKIGHSDLASIAKSLLQEVGYIAMWKAENTLESQGRLENIEEFINSLSEFSSITEFLEYVSLVEARDEKNSPDAVAIMTVHGAKGLEFDVVFLPGLEDGLFPSARSVEERNGLEEERRLMYVAITRAKKELSLSYAKNRYVFGEMQMQMPSRFIKELPQDELDIEDVAFGGSFLYSNRMDGFKNSASPKFGSNQSNFSQNSFGQNSFNRGSLSQNLNQGNYGKNNSSFAADLSKKVFGEKKNSSEENSLTGKRVFHQKFGYGKVLNSDGNKLEIEFEKTGSKTVMKDFISFA